MRFLLFTMIFAALSCQHKRDGSNLKSDSPKSVTIYIERNIVEKVDPKDQMLSIILDFAKTNNWDEIYVSPMAIYPRGIILSKDTEKDSWRTVALIARKSDGVTLERLSTQVKNWDRAGQGLGTAIKANFQKWLDAKIIKPSSGLTKLDTAKERRLLMKYSSMRAPIYKNPSKENWIRYFKADPMIGIIATPLRN